MTHIDLNQLSLKELKQLQKDLEKAISTFEDRQKTEARVALEEHARRLGFSLAELSGVEIKRKRVSNGPRYQHPEQPNVTWSGRGRKPQWFIEALAAGKSPEEMAVAG